jgi:hypothetical protein
MKSHHSDSEETLLPIAPKIHQNYKDPMMKNRTLSMDQSSNSTPFFSLRGVRVRLHAGVLCVASCQLRARNFAFLGNFFKSKNGIFPCLPPPISSILALGWSVIVSTVLWTFYTHLLHYYLGEHEHENGVDKLGRNGILGED